jgi:hypothetical protein
MKPFNFEWLLHPVGMTVFWGGVKRDLVRVFQRWQAALLVALGAPGPGYSAELLWVESGRTVVWTLLLLLLLLRYCWVLGYSK